MSLILGFAVTAAIWLREVASFRDLILRSVTTFWVMLLVGIYHGRVSVEEPPTILEVNETHILESPELLELIHQFILTRTEKGADTSTPKSSSDAVIVQ